MVTKMNAKEVALIARNYLEDMLGESIADVALEEVDLSQDELIWFITLSYRVKNPMSSFTMTKKEYKIFEVDINKREVISMKIRKVE